MTLVWLIGGLATLTVGAEFLVRGASGLARVVGLPALIIGLTVVAYGTSAPELAVSVKAGLANQADIALGNVVGSNTFNVLFILGISSLIVPLTVSAQLVRLDVPVMIAVSAMTWLFALDGSIGRVEGGLMVMGICAYTGLLVTLGKRNRSLSGENTSPPIKTARGRLVGYVLLVLVGLGLLVFGAGWLIKAAVVLARLMGVSELVIGLTIVAAGTSMPEVATSIMAAIRGERDIAVGNVVGSNIFNLLGVMGGSALVTDHGIAVSEAALRFDIPVMCAVAVACLPIFLTAGRISRWEGALFLAYYVAYIVFLILAATRHPAMGSFTAAMLWFFIPMTVLGLTVSMVVWLGRRKGRSSKQDSKW